MKLKPTPIVIDYNAAFRHAKSYEGEVYGNLAGHENLAMAYIKVLALIDATLNKDGIEYVYAHKELSKILGAK